MYQPASRATEPGSRRTPLLRQVPWRSMPSGVAVTVAAPSVTKRWTTAAMARSRVVSAVELVVELAGGEDTVLEGPELVHQSRMALEGAKEEEDGEDGVFAADGELAERDAVVVMAGFLGGGEGADARHVVFDLGVAVAEEDGAGAQAPPFGKGQGGRLWDRRGRGRGDF